MTTKRVILEVSDPGRYNYEYVKDSARLEKERMYDITYEAVLPLSVGKMGAYRKLKNDLDGFFGLYGRWEKRKIPCMAIVQVESDQLIRERKELAKKYSYFDFNGQYHQGVENNTDKSVFVQEQTLKLLITINTLLINLPLVNESQFKETIILSRSSAETMNELSLRKALQGCGFDLVEKECETDVFVITENR